VGESLQFGVYYTLRNPDRRPIRELYAEVLDNAALIESLGYDFVFVAEHHFMDIGCMPGVLPMLGAIAARTSTIKIGTYVLVLPLHHPMRVAEDVAVLQEVSQGRVVLGVAGGYRPEEFAGYGVDRSQRGRLMDDGIAAIRRAWNPPAGVDPTDAGPGVVLTPVPEPAPPIWVGGFAPAAVDRAVRLGDGYMIGGAGAVPSDEPYGYYVDALARHGKTQADVPLIGNRIAHVAATDEQAWTEARESVLTRFNAYAQWFKESGDTAVVGNQAVAGTEGLPRDQFVIGSPATCIESIRTYRAKFPVDILTFDANQPGLDPAAARRGLELFAREVIPAFSSP
jgi:alkanesulfonate monooxygenase SsuD/methylene tetrahydromethanopterin reductase-like flavin-dependent oxidoreductase (luciferase family)